MGKTKIQWVRNDDGTQGRTWNPITGCLKISPGCKNCWANRLHDMRHDARARGAKLPIQYAEPFEKVQLHPERLKEPLRWRKPTRVAVVLGGDLFNKDVPDEFIASVFAVMYLAKHHTFQTLTKRTQRMKELLNSHEFFLLIDRALRDQFGQVDHVQALNCWPFPNVWVGVSVENQKTADERIPHLLETPAAIRWLSCEPLLGPIDLEECAPYTLMGDTSNPGVMNAFNAKCYHPITCIEAPEKRGNEEGVQWVVCGGESGPDARPMQSTWADDLRQQCARAGVAFHFKQHGEFVDAGHPLFGKANKDKQIIHIDSKGKVLDPCPTSEDADCMTMVRVGNKAAGRKLYGVEYDEFPK